MVVGGFTCSKNALAALNVLYILVSFILIGVAAYSRLVAIVTSLALVGGIIACGVFLFLIALIGLIGACKHHQVLLFFYMLVLFLLFLLQFSLACACLAVNSDQRDRIAQTGWTIASNSTRAKVQENFNCCGFTSSEIPDHPSCSGLPCCTSSTDNATCACDGCLPTLREKIHYAFSITGGIGLFFSFTEIIGVWLALRYRNQKDPRANPSAFL